MFCLLDKVPARLGQGESFMLEKEANIYQMARTQKNKATSFHLGMKGQKGLSGRSEAKVAS